MLPLCILFVGAAAEALSQKTSETHRLLSSLPYVSAESSDRKRLDLQAPARNLWSSITDGPRRHAVLSPKAIHWFWDQDEEEKPSTFSGGGAMAAGLLMGSMGSESWVRGALWALDRAGVRTWKGASGESQGEDVDEEKEETSLDCWSSAKGVERPFGSTE